MSDPPTHPPTHTPAHWFPPAAPQTAVGDTLRLVLVGMGSEADLHSPAFTAQVQRSARAASLAAELLPAVAQTVDLRPRQRGVWPAYCSVDDHYNAGMRMMLHVPA